MSEPQHGGPTGPGPSFIAPVERVDPPDHGPQSPLRPVAAETTARPTADDFSPPRRWLPTVLTLAALILVGGVVAVASLRPAPTTATSAPAPVRISSPQASPGGLAPDPNPVPSSDPNSDPNSVPSSDPHPYPSIGTNTQAPFSTPYGEGVLTVVDHRRASARLLLVTVTVTAIRGQIDVDPTSFSVLDTAGATHELSFANVSSNELGVTRLRPGQSTTGQVQFEVPAGDVVLLMEDPVGGVTAIKVAN